ncbi:MAG: ATP-dependent Clp protease proteolytic subunit, partial [Rudaea sp.]|nr:ATP-dependent Clp protease proteolytic subunit [Rudaea sp.]
DKARDGILAAYRNKSGKSDEELTAMLDAETWMTAAEAKEAGFADEIEAPVKLSASVRAAGLLARFESAPSPVQALVDESLDEALNPDPPVNPDPDTPTGNPPPDTKTLTDPVPPIAPEPPVQAESPGALAAHVFSACRAVNLSACAESIVTITALKDRTTIDAAIRNASDIAGLCFAAKLPELTAQFVADGLNPDQVRARLFDRVTQAQERVNSRQPPLSNDAGTSGSAVPPAGPKASSVYAARRARMSAHPK